MWVIIGEVIKLNLNFDKYYMLDVHRHSRLLINYCQFFVKFPAKAIPHQYFHWYNTVEPLLKETLNKGHNTFYLPVKDKFCVPFSIMAIQSYLLKRTTSQ